MKRILSSLMILAGSLPAGLLSGGAAAFAQTSPSAPDFLNPKERLPLPSLQRLERLRFITTVDFPPFNMLNRQGQLSGYNVDLVTALCRQLGIEDVCQIEAVPWDELQGRLLGGGADAIIGGWQPTEERRKDFAFSRSYMRLPARFATLASKAFAEPASRATRGRSVGVIAGTAHEQLLKSYFPQALAKPYPNRATMLADLQGGRIDSVFDDGMALSFWLTDAGSRNCCTFTDGPYLAPQYLGSGLAVAVTQRNAAIVDAIDNALQALQRKGTLTELYLRYFPTSFY